MADFLDKAILAHTAWRSRLRTAIDTGDVIDADKTRKDDQCDLGRWIHGEGAKHQALPEYQSLKQKHAAFHQAASQVVVLIKAGNKTKATEELDRGTYAKIANEVVAAIKEMKGKRT